MRVAVEGIDVNRYLRPYVKNFEGFIGGSFVPILRYGRIKKEAFSPAKLASFFIFRAST
jgi:hypothetical protein